MKLRVRIALVSIGLLAAFLALPAPDAAARLKTAPTPPARTAATALPPSPRLAAALGGLPLCLAENLGQWQAATRFSGSVPGATVSFGSQGMTCFLTRRRPVEAGGAGTTAAGPFGGASDGGLLAGEALESLALRATFPGAAPAPELSGDAPAPHYSHYYLGNDPAAWRTDQRRRLSIASRRWPGCRGGWAWGAVLYTWMGLADYVGGFQAF